MTDGDSGPVVLDPAVPNTSADAQADMPAGATPGARRGTPRRALMILYHFPPMGGVAMSRNVRNVQYLPQSGWTPVVIGPEDPGELVDVGALAMVASGTAVIRARNPGPGHLRSVVAALRRSAGSRRSGSAADPGGPPSAGTAGPEVSTTSPSLAGRIAPLVLFPDEAIGWLPFAVAAALREHRARPIDAIYSTASPITSHLVAGVVKRLTGAPWIAEFRDPWVGNPFAAPLPWFHRRLRSRLERWIVHTADRLVFVSPSMTELYRRRYPNAAPMVTIPNGHDASEITIPAVAARPPGPFRIVWTGALYRPDELRQFLAALDSLVGHRPDIERALEIRFYGDVSSACAAVADRYAGQPVGRMIHFPGFVPRREAVRAVGEADAALVMLGAGRGMDPFIPGKLFDYIGQSKQILAVLPPGDARDVLVELGWGVVADPDPSSICGAIERLLELPPVTGVADPEGRYDRRVLAGRLAAELDAVTAARPSAARPGANA